MMLTAITLAARNFFFLVLNSLTLHPLLSPNLPHLGLGAGGRYQVWSGNWKLIPSGRKEICQVPYIPRPNPGARRSSASDGQVDSRATTFWQKPITASDARPLARSHAGGRLLGERLGRLWSRAYVELREHLVEVPFDRPPAKEEHRADVRVGEAVAGEARDLIFLRGELVTGLVVALAHLQTRREKFRACAFSERLHADPVEHQ